MARVSFHHLDVTLAPFPADHFDLVYSRDCIMHIADKEKVHHSFLVSQRSFRPRFAAPCDFLFFKKYY